MNLRKSLSNLGVTTALTCCLSLAAAACSSDSQPLSPADAGGSAATVTGGQASTATGGASDANVGGSQASASSGGATASLGDSGGNAASTGGKAAAGGRTGAGGTAATGGASEAGIGGNSGTGTKSSGGTKAVGGSPNTGGATAKSVGGNPSVGGTWSNGGSAAGGMQGDGGATGSGGSKAAGGSASVGGTKGAGGTRAVGGTTATGGTNSTGTVTISYCPVNEPCRISPLGDSITEGMGWTPAGASTWGGGYRIKLFSLANAEAKSFTFVGTRTNGPNTVDGKTFPQKHEGTSGISIENLQRDVVDAGKLTGSAVNPHIILLHIGTNNMYGSHTSTPEAFMASLLDKIIAACPNALLVVAKIIPYPGNASGIQSFNDKLPAMVKERADKGAHIVLVDQHTGFPSSELADGVHPNEAGYTRMAGVWYKAISQYLR